MEFFSRAVCTSLLFFVYLLSARIRIGTEDPMDGTQEQLLAGEIDHLLTAVRCLLEALQTFSRTS